MSMISNLGQSVVRNGAKAACKCFKLSPTTTKMVNGIAVSTNRITGTQVTKVGDFGKAITLGAGNRLSKLLGEGTQIVSYPKGGVFGDKKIGLPDLGLLFSPEGFGEYLKMLRELAKVK